MYKVSQESTAILANVLKIILLRIFYFIGLLAATPLASRGSKNSLKPSKILNSENAAQANYNFPPNLSVPVNDSCIVSQASDDGGLNIIALDNITTVLDLATLGYGIL